MSSYLQRQIAAIGPGRRLPEPINPLIVLRDGRPYLAGTSIGSGLFDATVQGLVNVLDYGMDPKRAQHVALFRPPDFGDLMRPTRVTWGEFPLAVLDRVRNLGIPIFEQLPDEASGFGYWISAVIDPASGRLIAATLNEFNGHAEGY